MRVASAQNPWPGHLFGSLQGIENSLPYAKCLKKGKEKKLNCLIAFAILFLISYFSTNLFNHLFCLSNSSNFLRSGHESICNSRLEAIISEILQILWILRIVRNYSFSVIFNEKGGANLIMTRVWSGHKRLKRQESHGE